MRDPIIEDYEHEEGSQENSLIDIRTTPKGSQNRSKYTIKDKDTSSLVGGLRKEQVEEVKSIVNSKIDKFNQKYLKPKLEERFRK